MTEKNVGLDNWRIDIATERNEGWSQKFGINFSRLSHLYNSSLTPVILEIYSSYGNLRKKSWFAKNV